MKYVLIIVIVLAVIWFVRNNRRSDQPKAGAPPKATPLAQPQDMVCCPICSLHLPRTDALPGPDGSFYCCADHRSRAGE